MKAACWWIFLIFLPMIQIYCLVIHYCYTAKISIVVSVYIAAIFQPPVNPINRHCKHVNYIYGHVTLPSPDILLCTSIEIILTLCEIYFMLVFIIHLLQMEVYTFHFFTCPNCTGNNNDCHPHWSFSYWEMRCIEKCAVITRLVLWNTGTRCVGISQWLAAVSALGVGEWKSVASMTATFYTFQLVGCINHSNPITCNFSIQYVCTKCYVTNPPMEIAGK